MAHLEPATPTGSITAGSDFNYNLPANIRGIMLVAGGATATVVIHDNPAAASGTILAALTVPASTSISQDFGAGIIGLRGITITVTGAGAFAYGYFSPSS